MAAAEFGAEAGAYSLLSTPQEKPYDAQPAPPQPNPPCVAENWEPPSESLCTGCPTIVVPTKSGAMVWKIDDPAQQCAKFSLDTFAACTVNSVTGTVRDLVNWNDAPAAIKQQSTGDRLTEIFTQNKRYIYISVLIVALIALQSVIARVRRK